MPNHLSELCDLVSKLIADGAIHIKRGFKLSDVPKSVVSNHLLEEVVELQAEVLAGDSTEAVKKEAADVLLVFVHLLHSSGIPLWEVSELALETLKKQFTFDPSMVTAIAPGFTRNARAEEKQ